jgi:apolipoprotein N-acyltransferase
MVILSGLLLGAGLGLYFSFVTWAAFKLWPAKWCR